MRPDPLGGCVAPYHNGANVNAGGPHGTASQVGDIDGGKMDGFVKEAEGKAGCKETTGCGKCKTTEACGAKSWATTIPRDSELLEVRGRLRLQDHLFESVGVESALASGDGLRLGSEVRQKNDESAEVHRYALAERRGEREANRTPPKANYAWTDVTYLMYKHGVTWRYYIHEGEEPDCENNEEVTCEKVELSVHSPESGIRSRTSPMCVKMASSATSSPSRTS